MYIKKFNLLFIHIPKTAGTSITHYMNFLGGDNYYEKTLPLNFVTPRWAGKYTHLPLKYYKYFLDNNTIENSIKFTVIRNPLSRLKSWYYFNRSQGYVDIPINKFLPQMYKEINFIQERGYSLDHDDISGESVYDTLGVMRQVDFFQKEDNVHLLKLENLQSNFNEFTSKHNLPKFEIPLTNTTEKIDTRFFIKEMCSGHPSTMKNFIFDYYKEDYDLWASLT